MIKGKNMDNHCNRCPATLRGLCCWFSYDDGTDNFVIYPCEHLSRKTRRCKIYKKRSKVKHCLPMEEALKEGALPEDCPYVAESSIVPIRPHKTYNKKKLEMIKKNGIQKGRFHISNSSQRTKGIST